MTFDELSVVALAVDVPALGLTAGMRGTVVMVYGNHEAYEVEFVAPDGDTIALDTFRPEQLRSRKATRRDLPASRMVFQWQINDPNDIPPEDEE